MFFKISMPILREEKDEFSIASQHYDFLPPTITAFSERYPDYKNFRILSLPQFKY